MAKIDILIPYWGDFELLKRAVDSVLAQTEKDFRLLIFDDCYPDKTAQKYYSKHKDKRVIYHRHQKNLGITGNFNFALGRVQADFCVMMGCDDEMLPNYIETALKNIGQNDFYQPNVEVIDANSRVYLPLGDKVKRLLQPRQSGTYGGQKLAVSLCLGNWLYFPAITWRSQVIKKYGFNPKYKIVEDLDLEFNLILAGCKLFFDKDNKTFRYRRFAKSLSSRERKKTGVRFAEEAGLYKKYASVFERSNWPSASRAAKIRLTSRLHNLLS